VVKVEGCSIVGYFLHVCSAAQRAKLEESNWSISLLWLVVYPVCVQTGRAEQRLQLIFQVQVVQAEDNPHPGLEDNFIGFQMGTLWYEIFYALFTLLV
jgi:hypothetical protein